MEKKEGMQKLYKISALLCILCLTLGLFGGYVLAATPTTTTYLTPGIYAGAPSYTISTDGTNFFAKNNLGEIVYSGSNCSEVINDAVDDALPYGSVECKGYLTLSSPILITITEYSTLSFSFETLKFTMDSSAFTVYTALAWVSCPITIKGQLIECSYNGYTHSAFQLVNINHATVNINQIFLSGTSGVNDKGLKLYANYPSTDCSFNRISIKKITGFETAIHLEANSSACDSNEIFDTTMDYCVLGLNMQTSGTGRVNHNKFYGLNADAYSGDMQYGFRNLGENNIFVSCLAFDQSYSLGLVADWYTNAQSDNSKPRLYGCTGMNFSGSFIHHDTVGYVTESYGEASVADETDIEHGLAGEPTEVYLQYIGSGATIKHITWDRDDTNSTTFRVGIKDVNGDPSSAWFIWRAYYMP